MKQLLNTLFACRPQTSGILSLAVWLFLCATHAQASLDEEIAEVNQEIHEQGEVGALYLKRGKLHMIGENWNAALTDLGKAETLDPDLIVVNFHRAEARFAQNSFQDALQYLERYLPHSKEDSSEDRGRAFFLLGQIQSALDNPSAAADAYKHSIEALDRPTPELLLLRAQALISAGSSHRQEAIETLDEGSKKLGSIVVLERFALELETSGQDWNAALRRLERLIAQNPRPEFWLLEKAEILIRLDQFEGAENALLDARQLLDSLPDHRRQNPRLLELAVTIEQKLEALRSLH